MTFPNFSSLKTAIIELKDIVSRSQNEDHEAAQLLSQIEALFLDIENKVRQRDLAVSQN